MKKLIYILLLISINSFSQTNTWDIVNHKYFVRDPYIKTDSLRVRLIHLERWTTFPAHPDTGWIINKLDTFYIFKANHTWDTIGPRHAGSTTIPFNGNRTVTRVGLPAINAGGTTLSAFIENYFFPSTSPTATLTGGLNLEYENTGSDLATSLNYSGTRPTACLAISSISINGSGQTLDSPFAEGHTQSGTYEAVYPRNTTTTFTITVTSSDSKTGTASTSFHFYWAKYWGKINSNAAPSDAAIRALTGAGVGSGYDLITTPQTRAKDYSGINGAGDYLIFAFPTAWGDPIFKVYGLTNTGFTRVRNNTFYNASGGSTSYQVWISNDRMNSPITDIKIE